MCVSSTDFSVVWKLFFTKILAFFFLAMQIYIYVRTVDFGGRVPAQEPPRISAEARPLPRLRAEGAERRRGALKKARASKAPIYLGGVVSGIKHTFLGRRCANTETKPTNHRRTKEGWVAVSSNFSDPFGAAPAFFGDTLAHT